MAWIDYKKAYWFKDTKGIALDLTEFQNQVHDRKFLRE